MSKVKPFRIRPDDEAELEDDGEVTVDEVTVDEVTVDEVTVDEVTVDEVTVDDVSAVGRNELEPALSS